MLWYIQCICYQKRPPAPRINRKEEAIIIVVIAARLIHFLVFSNGDDSRCMILILLHYVDVYRQVGVFISL